MIEGLSEHFMTGLRQLDLSLSDQQLEQFLRYQQELLNWNARFNLTAITDPEGVQVKHFLDSLTLLTVRDRSRARLLDIGSGAGFPGLALKIARPEWQITLLEATGKKVTFLRHIIETLHLDGIEAIQGRAEELAHQSSYRAAFDMVTARAVASLPILLEYSAPYCRVGGAIILPKKGELADELLQGKRTAGLLGARFKADLPVQIAGLADGRRLLVWEQQKLCPAQFPRAGTVMAKKPLV
ncbi:MAG: 16S rRNA (guanine(527)-N(7))-methyltransferase RsmG [Chloroflexota bacterium]|nr:16S rRNA (guanine(527)-N(7))-methyltransferase RsmG [Chloroflexota bacterium]